MSSLTPEGLDFVSVYHLATLSTLAADGTIHAVPVGFTLVGSTARIITGGSSQKVRNIRERGHATISQVDGGRWITLIGTGRVETDAAFVKEAVDLYSARYRVPRANPERVAILIEVERMMGSPTIVDRG